MATKLYIDLPDMQAYHNNIKTYITENTVRETVSTTAPTIAEEGDFWTELINDNEE